MLFVECIWFRMDMLYTTCIFLHPAIGHICTCNYEPLSYDLAVWLFHVASKWLIFVGWCEYFEWHQTGCHYFCRNVLWNFMYSFHITSIWSLNLVCTLGAFKFGVSRIIQRVVSKNKKAGNSVFARDAIYRRTAYIILMQHSVPLSHCRLVWGIIKVKF